MGAQLLSILQINTKRQLCCKVFIIVQQAAAGGHDVIGQSLACHSENGFSTNGQAAKRTPVYRQAKL